jgi:hypothetical protein
VGCPNPSGPAISTFLASKRCTNNNHEDGDNAKDEAATPTEDATVLLLCGTCLNDEEATLWCSSCFAVYCNACWTTKHHSIVDMSVLNDHGGLPLVSARPVRTVHRDYDNNNVQQHTPPVDMVYLPTKPVVVGKRMRGSAAIQQRDASQSAQELEGPEMRGDDEEGEVPITRSLSSHAIQPAPKPIPKMLGNARSRQSTPGLSRAFTSTPEAPSSMMDSTANLLKALMLGTASSASVMGATSASTGQLPASTSVADSKRIYHERVKRKKLVPSHVTFDASALIHPATLP